MMIVLIWTCDLDTGLHGILKSDNPECYCSTWTRAAYGGRGIESHHFPDRASPEFGNLQWHVWEEELEWMILWFEDDADAVRNKMKWMRRYLHLNPRLKMRRHREEVR